MKKQLLNLHYNTQKGSFRQTAWFYLWMTSVTIYASWKSFSISLVRFRFYLLYQLYIFSTNCINTQRNTHTEMNREINNNRIQQGKFDLKNNTPLVFQHVSHYIFILQFYFTLTNVYEQLRLSLWMLKK